MFFVTDFCGHLHSCGECNQQEQCLWLNETLGCVLSNLSISTECSHTQNPTSVCSDYRHCESCYVHGCWWNGSHCYSQLRFKGITLYVELISVHPAHKFLHYHHPQDPFHFENIEPALYYVCSLS